MIERFLSKVDKRADGCWHWTAALMPNGYGYFRVSTPRRRMVYAHRAAYELLVGPIPDGMVIDHLCRNKSCVNPEHLEVVTQGENVRRGWELRKKVAA